MASDEEPICGRRLGWDWQPDMAHFWLHCSVHGEVASGLTWPGVERFGRTCPRAVTGGQEDQQ